MKTIKQEIYKGYRIEVKAEYKEDTIVSINPEYNYDSIKIEAHKEKVAVLGSWSVVKNAPEESEVIEFRKGEKMKAYDSLNKTADKMIDKVKQYIDKKEREKEMTDGLPESLLADNEVIVTLQNGEIILPEGVRITTHDGKYMEFTENGLKVKGYQITSSYPELKS